MSEKISPEYRHTLRICNTYCLFSAKKTVTRTRLNITLQYVDWLLNKSLCYSKPNITDRFLFPAELYCLNTDYWSINDCNIQHVGFEGVARHEMRISAHLATVCSHQQHNRPHDVTGSCLIGLQLAVGSRKLICGSNKSWPQDFQPVGFYPCFFKAEIIILVAQLNHGSLDATMCLYRGEQKHWKAL